MKAAVGSVRSTDAVHQDVNATPLLEKAVHHRLHTICRPYVRLDEQRGLLTFEKRRTRGGRDRTAAQRQPADDGFSHSFGATSHQDALALELVSIKQKMGSLQPSLNLQ